MLKVFYNVTCAEPAKVKAVVHALCRRTALSAVGWPGNAMPQRKKAQQSEATTVVDVSFDRRVNCQVLAIVQL